jgi:hypothetical protein
MPELRSGSWLKKSAAQADEPQVALKRVATNRSTAELIDQREIMDTNRSAASSTQSTSRKRLKKLHRTGAQRVARLTEIQKHSKVIGGRKVPV